MVFALPCPCMHSLNAISDLGLELPAPVLCCVERSSGLESLGVDQRARWLEGDGRGMLSGVAQL